MKILAISDCESIGLWDYFEKAKVEGVDLILSCGDLDPHYLSFLTTMAGIPVFYIHGNHDEKYDSVPPEGCTCIEDRICVFEGLRILGLGGSMRYLRGKKYQYTERQMQNRALRLLPVIFRKKGFDILVTHAPAAGLNDGKDLPHHGFQTFLRLIDKYQPICFVHGHVHMNYDRAQKRRDQLGNTHVFNAYERCIIELEMVGGKWKVKE